LEIAARSACRNWTPFGGTVFERLGSLRTRASPAVLQAHGRGRDRAVVAPENQAARGGDRAEDETSERRALLDSEQLSVRAREIVNQIDKDAVPGPWAVVGYPSAGRKSEKSFLNG